MRQKNFNFLWVILGVVFGFCNIAGGEAAISSPVGFRSPSLVIQASRDYRIQPIAETIEKKPLNIGGIDYQVYPTNFNKLKELVAANFLPMIVGVTLPSSFALAKITGIDEGHSSLTLHLKDVSIALSLKEFQSQWDQKIYVPASDGALREHVEAVLTTEFGSWIDWENIKSPLSALPFGQFIYPYIGSVEGVTINPNIVTDSELNNKVLEMNVEVEPDSRGYAWLGFALWRIQDLSDVKYLVLDIKADRPLTDKQLKIELNRVPRHPLERTDIKNWIYLPEGTSITTNWQRLYIPLPDKLSTAAINALVFTFEAWRGAQTGTIWVNNVGFARERK